MGNSEVGHLNIGAGRIVAQDLVRVGDAVADGTLAANPALQAAFAAAETGRGVLHVAGLVSDGGVHSHVDHLRAIVRARSRPACRASPCTRSRTGATSRRTRRPACSRRSSGEWAGTGAVIATVVGRYYAMDRDHRAERTELARAALVDGVGERAIVGVGRGRGELRHGPHRRVRHAGRARRHRPAHRARRSRSCSSTSAPTAPARSATRCCRRSACS